MKKITLNFYADPGHGWLKCNRKLVFDLGVESQISRFSYQRGDSVFLEEDCDAPVVMRALEAKGVKVAVKYHSGNKSSRIRNYFCFRLRDAELNIK